MKKIITLIFVIILNSCDNDGDNLRSNPIDSNITIEFRELLGTDSRQLSFFCQTGKIYPCINYPILTEQNFENDILDITFTKVIETDICLTAIGPATTNVFLPSLVNGTYEIALNNSKLANKGKLEISNDKVDVIFENEKGIIIKRQSTRRVPLNTYWGTIGYHSATTINKVNDFLQKASELGVDFSYQKPGHYFYYEIDENGEIVENIENSGYYFLKGFIFQYTGDEDLFKKEIKELAVTYYDDMYINIETYKGERIYNWGE